MDEGLEGEPGAFALFFAGEFFGFRLFELGGKGADEFLGLSEATLGGGHVEGSGFDSVIGKDGVGDFIVLAFCGVSFHLRGGREGIRRGSGGRGDCGRGVVLLGMDSGGWVV